MHKELIRPTNIEPEGAGGGVVSGVASSSQEVPAAGSGEETKEDGEASANEESMQEEVR